jgi:hypothetical protein
MALNIYKDIYRRSVRKKILLKILYILGNIKRQISDSKIIYIFVRNLSFLYF